jgi:hypothetical protein
MFGSVNDPGVVAITLKKGEAFILTDKDGNRIAAVMANDRMVGKTQLVVCASKSIRIKRERQETNEVA